MLLNPLISDKIFAQLLGTSLTKLNYSLYVRNVETQYHQFTIHKKNGSERNIFAPIGVLKTYQRKLKPLLDQLYRPHDAAHAFVEGRSIVTNAKRHLRSKIVLNIDLKDFYDQIHFGRVLGLFMAEPYSLDANVARLIAQICCVNKKLPQGGITSPVLSNMVCRRLDRELSYLAKRYRATYSRYADDITFSFTHLRTEAFFTRRDNSLLLGSELLSIVESNGFSVNDNKTRVQLNSERQIVTGLKVNRKPNVDRRYIRTTRAMVHSLKQGIEQANKLFETKENDNPARGRLENVVHGRINFIGMVKGVESSVYQTLAKKFNNLDIDLKLRTVPKTPNEKLEQKLHFNSYSNRERLENSVWVLDFDDIESVAEDVDAACYQGSAFMVKGNKLLTAAHNFKSENQELFCRLYRINDRFKTYIGKVVYICRTRDVALIEFQEDPKQKFPYLDVASSNDLNAGYMVSLVGFPYLTAGHKSVNIIPATITNRLQMATFYHYELDKVIISGMSGGPAVNAYMQVVGMNKYGFEEGMTGRNAILSAQHFPEMTW